MTAETTDSAPGWDHPSGLNDRERALLDFAALTWRWAGNRDQAVRDQFHCSYASYWMQILGLIRRPEAMEYAPATVQRLTRMREENAAKRSRHSLEA